MINGASDTSSSHKDTSRVTPIIKYKLDNFFGETVLKDYYSLKENVRLSTTPRVGELHLMHSVYGHACEGHSEFYDIVDGKRVPVQYKNITLDDVVSRIPGEDTQGVKDERQKLIDEISEWIDGRIETLRNPGRKPMQQDVRLITVYDSVSKDQRVVPLAGVSMFEHAILKNFESVLMGFYLGSCMDSHEWREKVDKKFGIQMHKGSCVPANINKLKQYNLSLDDLQNSKYLDVIPGLTHASSEEKINVLKDFGIISKESCVPNGKTYKPAFLELSKGYGISDDAAFITASLRFGTEAGFGLLLADAIDTLDKHAPKILSSGQDEVAGKMLRNSYESRLHRQFPISDDQILTFIYLSAMSRDTYADFPSCSQRRFWQKDSNGMTAVQSHMSFLNFLKNDSKYPPMTRIGFKGVSNEKFYTAYVRKLEDAVSRGIIDDDYSLNKKRNMLNPD